MPVSKFALVCGVASMTGGRVTVVVVTVRVGSNEEGKKEDRE